MARLGDKGRMKGTLGSHHGRADNADGSGRVTGDLGVAKAKEQWKKIPEKDRIGAVKAFLKGRKG
jgi:hypothetical protein